MTLKGIFNWIVGVPIAVVGVGFAVANRQWVTISFDPINRVISSPLIDLPLWALFFAGIFIGIFAGWNAAWRGNAQIPPRRARGQDRADPHPAAT